MSCSAANLPRRSSMPKIPYHDQLSACCRTCWAGWRRVRQRQAQLRVWKTIITARWESVRSNSPRRRPGRTGAAATAAGGSPTCSYPDDERRTEIKFDSNSKQAPSAPPQRFETYISSPPTRPGYAFSGRSRLTANSRCGPQLYFDTPTWTSTKNRAGEYRKDKVRIRWYVDNRIQAKSRLYRAKIEGKQRAQPDARPPHS
jgi:hypothetical protein